MANSPYPIAGFRKNGADVPLGMLATAVLILMALTAIGALFGVGAPWPEGLNTSLLSSNLSRVTRVVGFTFWQASLSALLSLLVALPVAITFLRRALTSRLRNLNSLIFLSIVMPTTVAVSGLLGVWGQNGIISHLLRAIGADGLSPIYGLGAVLLAHVFFNAPLMLRVFLSGLSSIPAAQWRLAAQWGFSDWQRFRLIEWPVLKPLIPGVVTIVFLLCFTSFSLILMLGGGPGVTTLEVSIYTALRFEFDMPMAAFLSLIQLTICAVLVAILARFDATGIAAIAPLTSKRLSQPGDTSHWTVLLDTGVIAAFSLLALAPLATVIIAGISSNLLNVMGWPAFHRALLASLIIAIASALLATALATVMAAARVRVSSGGKWVFDLAVSLYLAVSAIVLGTGLFILLRGLVDVFLIAPFILLLANMLVALPFSYRVIQGKMAMLARSQDKLCNSLDLRGWRRFRLITFPALAPELGFAAGLSAALSLGDMTVIALFGSQQFQTLPWLLYQTMGRYRAEDAAALALLLLVLTLILFGGFVKGAALLRGRQIDVTD
jgi:thiamine transport system permease protein